MPRNVFGLAGWQAGRSQRGERMRRRCCMTGAGFDRLLLRGLHFLGEGLGEVDLFQHASVLAG
jgi:hypothetical protein